MTNCKTQQLSVSVPGGPLAVSVSAGYTCGELTICAYLAPQVPEGCLTHLPSSHQFVPVPKHIK